MPVIEFPFFRPELATIENQPHTRISCWLHGLRDAMYATGVRDTKRRFVQPLDLGVEHPYGVLSIFGGLDSHYFAPSFSDGLRARWAEPASADDGLEIVRAQLAAGKAVPACLDFARMPHSRYYRVGTFGIPHTAVIFGIDDAAGIAHLADYHTREGSGFVEFHGTIPIAELRTAMQPCTLLVWDVDDAARTERDTAGLIADSAAALERATADPVFPYLREVTERHGGTRSGAVRFRRDLGYNVMRRVAADRLLFAEVIGGRADGATVAGALTAAAAAGEEWAQLARTLLLFTEHWTPVASERFLRLVDACEARERELATALRCAADERAALAPSRR
jgi:hypothetical protein